MTIYALREAVIHTILLDLHKAYNALDRSRCLDILEGYGVGPGPSAYSVGIGRGLRWWGRREDTTDNASAEREASHKAIHCRPQSLICWWKRWSATGSTWWWNRREGGGSNDYGNTAHPEGRTIQERDNGRRLAEEGHAILMVKAELF